MLLIQRLLTNYVSNMNYFGSQFLIRLNYPVMLISVSFLLGVYVKYIFLIVILVLLLGRSWKLKMLLVIGVAIGSVFVGNYENGLESNLHKHNLKEHYLEEAVFQVYKEPSYTLGSEVIFLRNKYQDDEVGYRFEKNTYPKTGLFANCTVTGKFKEIENFGGDFDYKKYMNRQNVFFEIDRYARVECIEYEGASIRYSIYKLKRSLISRIKLQYPEPISGLVAGMLFGEDWVFLPKFEESLQNSGLSHVVAASGFNILFVAGFVQVSLGRIISRSKLSVVKVVAILAYCCMNGFSASVVRASFMIGVVLLSGSSGRLLLKPHLLTSVVVLSVLFDINILYDVGFQLSLGATLGLAYLKPLLEKLYSGFTFAELSTTLSAYFGTLPVSVFHFGEVSAVSILANLVCLPLIEFVVVTSLLSLFPLIGNIFNYVTYVQVSSFVFLTEILGRVEVLTLPSGFGLLMFLLILNVLFSLCQLCPE